MGRLCVRQRIGDVVRGIGGRDGVRGTGVLTVDDEHPCGGCSRERRCAGCRTPCQALEPAGLRWHVAHDRCRVVRLQRRHEHDPEPARVDRQRMAAALGDEPAQRADGKAAVQPFDSCVVSTLHAAYRTPERVAQCARFVAEV